MSWVSCVEFALKQIGVSSSQACLTSFPYMVKFEFINLFITNLTTYLAKCNETQEGKLRTYVFFFFFFFFFFKTIFKKEKYLSVINNADIRKCFMAFRISWKLK